MKILSVESDSKTSKSVAFGYLTGVCYLSPAKISGKNLCPGSSAGCRAACLYTAGFAGIYKTVNQARENRTQFFLKNQNAFMTRLQCEIIQLAERARARGLAPVVRLNGTTDIQWENILLETTGKNVFESFPAVQFMDYTKILARCAKDSAARAQANYHLTFSRSEKNETAAKLALAAGVNVAVVFESGPKKNKKPSEFWGARVIDGDVHDLRFLDGKSVIVGLSAKGRARKDASGFTVHLNFSAPKKASKLTASK